MKPIRFSKRLITAGILAAVVATSALAYARVGGGYDLTWNTVDGGGSTSSTGGVYTLGGTIGQPNAGQMSGGVYGLTGGFWSAAATSSVLVGHVSWQGRTAGTSAYRLPITLTLKLGASETNYPSQATDASGFFTVPVGSLATGTYNWRVKDPKYLANAGTVALTGAQTFSQEMGQMRAADASNDNLITVLDFNILKFTFGRGFGDPGYDDRADFDGTLIVTVVDFNLLKGNFGTGGAPPVRPGTP